MATNMGDGRVNGMADPNTNPDPMFRGRAGRGCLSC